MRFQKSAFVIKSKTFFNSPVNNEAKTASETMELRPRNSNSLPKHSLPPIFLTTRKNLFPLFFTTWGKITFAGSKKRRKKGNSRNSRLHGGFRINLQSHKQKGAVDTFNKKPAIKFHRDDIRARRPEKRWIAVQGGWG